MSKTSPLSKELYQLIVKMGIEGFDNLLKTYNSLDTNPIIQVVNMYKNLLENNNQLTFSEPSPKEIKCKIYSAISSDSFYNFVERNFEKVNLIDITSDYIVSNYSNLFINDNNGANTVTAPLVITASPPSALIGTPPCE